jgi:hypothetical protein
MDADQTKHGNKRVWISLFVISMSVVAFEIQLMHFFSIVQWQHFASMVISIALLGFGTSGTLITLFREKMLRNSSILVPLFMMSSGLMMMIALPMSRLAFFRLDTFTLFSDPSQIGKLTLNYLLFFLPFLLAALSIGLVYVKKASTVGNYYFADLTGAGFGGLLALTLMWTMALQWILWVVASLPILAGLLLLNWEEKRTFIRLSCFGAACLAFLTYSSNQPLDLKPSPYKSISYALNLPGARITEEHHSPYGWLQIVSSPAQRFAPGLSLNAPIEIPPSPVVFNNGNWYAPIPLSDAALQVLDYSTMGAPFEMRRPEKVLQLGSGAGFEVQYALRRGATRVVAVEQNAVLVNLLRDSFASRTDSVFYDVRVNWHIKSSRSFLENNGSEFDLVQLPLMGTFGGSVGLNALEEDWVFTREGFMSIWKQLNNTGMISVSCWIDMPQKMSIRLGALLSDLLEQNGVGDPSEHLVVLRSWGTLTFVLSKPPLSLTERRALDDFCKSRQFDVLTPDIASSKVNKNKKEVPTQHFNLIQDADFETNLKISMGPERDSLLTHYPFHVEVPTDNKPYFFQFLRISDWKQHKDQWRESRTAQLELGYFLLLITFAQLLVFSFVLVLLPLLRLKTKISGNWRGLLYFGCLGVGYMFLEIILIKYFTMYLGHPIYSASAVISIMLISSGLGSRYSERFALESKFHIRILLLIALIGLIYSMMLGPFLSGTIGLNIGIKLVLTLIVVGAPAFFMGMPFPLGLKKLNSLDQESVPWAWGINGFASVISVSLAVILAVEAGLVAVLLLSSIAYSLSLYSIRGLT